jgi:hypothetical protein
MPGVLDDYGVLFAGHVYVAPNAANSTAVVDSIVPELGTSVELTITALNGVTPAPNRGVRVTVDDDQGLTIPTAPRTNTAGECVIDIAVAADADETLRTLSISVGGVTLVATPVFTPTAP